MSVESQNETTVSQETKFQPESLAIVTGTFYPDWKGPFTGTLRPDNLRGDLAITTLTVAVNKGYMPFVVDGGSSPEFVDEIKAKQIPITPQKEGKTQGAARRQALELAE